MRSAVVSKLIELSTRDDRVYLVTSDTGFHVFDEYQTLFPDRYLNIGIAESAMIGVAAGLALSGKTVFVYGIIPFVTMRCFEQIRNDLCFQKLSVKILGVGQGLTYGSEGPTHHAIEDIALMSCLPNMTVLCPGDPVEAACAVEASMSLDNPVYIRIGKSGEKVVHTDGIRSFQIGKGIVLREGNGLAIISTGNMVETSIQVDALLRERGLSPAVVSMHTVKPIDREMIVSLCQTCGVVATIEEHSVIGGLGSVVSDVIVQEGLDVRLIKFAVPDRYVDFTGGQEYLRDHFGLTPSKISETLLSICDEIQ